MFRCILPLLAILLFAAGCRNTRPPKELSVDEKIQRMMQAYEQAGLEEDYLLDEIDRLDAAEQKLDAEHQMAVKRAMAFLSPEVKAGNIPPPPQSWTGESRYRSTKGHIQTQRDEIQLKLSKTRNSRMGLKKELDDAFQRVSLGRKH